MAIHQDLQKYYSLMPPYKDRTKKHSAPHVALKRMSTNSFPSLQMAAKWFESSECPWPSLRTLIGWAMWDDAHCSLPLLCKAPQSHHTAQASELSFGHTASIALSSHCNI